MRLNSETTTILNGAALSSIIDAREINILAVVLPTWTNANVSFQGSVDGANFFDVYTTAGEFSINAGLTGGKIVALTADQLATLGGLMWLKVRSGLTGGPVNQAADRIINLVYKPKNARN